MSRSLLPFLALVLLPTGVLAFFAFRAADQDHREEVSALRARAEDEADALKRRVEAAVADAASRAEKAFEEAAAGEARDRAVGFAAQGEWHGYHAPAKVTEPEEGGEEARYFHLSLRGGESYEHALKDPARALDAYAFYLPRIRSPDLRARLRFRMARAALASGEVALGKALLRGVLEDAAGATEDGLPIDLLAALRLEARDEVRRLLREEPGRIPTTLLGSLRGVLPEEAGLARLLERRRALEEAVARDPEVLASREAVLRDGYLLLARDLPGSPARAVALEPVALPPLEAGGLEVRIEYSTPASVPRDDPGPGEAARAHRPVRLGKSGPELARLQVEDLLFPAKREALDGRRNLHRTLVGLLLLMTLAGGIALIHSVSRERRLARLRSRLLANVSHELKTPVTSIRMFSEMLADEPPDGPRSRRFAELLRAESLRLSQLIENLLDFSKLGRKEETLQREPVDLGALLHQVAEGFSVRAREKGVEFSVGNGPGNGTGNGALPTVHTSASALERILVNLLDNALKYRSDSSPRITLRGAASGDQVLITVADNGIGIPRRDRERVFEEFYRVRYEDYGVQGSGLGLSIARRLARKLGGEITLESREGAGSEFTLRLPGKGSGEPA